MPDPAVRDVYLVVTFAGNTNTAYHPHITMTAGFNEFAFDAQSGCNNDLSCPKEGNIPAAGLSEWEVVYTAGDPTSFPPGGTVTNFIPIPAVGSNGQVLLHVYRRSGQPVSCNSYTISVTNQ
jgi:hypothetical protein